MENIVEAGPSSWSTDSLTYAKAFLLAMRWARRGHGQPPIELDDLGGAFNLPDDPAPASATTTMNQLSLWQLICEVSCAGCPYKLAD